MAERLTPRWKQVYDTVERSIAPRIDEFARSEEMAAMAALNKRGQTVLSRRLEQLSRRVLHVMNLPAGSDVNRLLTHIAQLEREVRDLRKQVTDENDAEFLASLATRRTARAAEADPTHATRKSAPAKPAAAGKTAAAKTSAAAKKTAAAKNSAVGGSRARKKV